MNIWLVHGVTESGDDWSFLFRNEPSDSHIMKAISEDSWLIDEYDAGCIQSWKVVKDSVIEN